MKKYQQLSDTSGINAFLPFTGRWRVGATPARRIPSHGTDLFGVAYAIDFIAVNQKNRSSSKMNWHSLFGTEPPELFFAFGMPVLAPISGKIVDLHNGEPDHAARRNLPALIPYALGQKNRIHQGAAAIAGNYLVIYPNDSDSYILIAHLKLDSIAVEIGQCVTVGQKIAACGNSGNSTQPHIHIQAMTSMDFSVTRGLPLYFKNFLQEGGTKTIVLENEFPKAHHIVENAEISEREGN